MEDPIPDLNNIQNRVRELEDILENCRRDEFSESPPSDSHDFIRNCGFLLQSKIEQIVSECSDVGLLEDRDFDAYLGRLQQDLNSVKVESSNVSDEFEGLIRTHDEEFYRLHFDLAQLKCSLDFVPEKDLEKAKLCADVDNHKYVKDQLDQMNVNAYNFKLLELENQTEKNIRIFKSLQDLECESKRLDEIEQIEDGFTGLKVIAFGENCIRLSLRTYIPKLDDLLPPKEIGDATEPFEVNHELLIELLEGTMDLRNVEIFPNDVYINDIYDAAKSLSESSLQSFVTKVQVRIVICSMVRLVVKSANKSRHSLEYLDRDETIVAHVVGGVDASIKIPQGWPLLRSPLKLIYLKSSDTMPKLFGKTICREELPRRNKGFCGLFHEQMVIFK